MPANPGDASAAEQPPFRISRTFDAPRALVYQAWTEADRLAAWFGPKSFQMKSSKLDLTPGGAYHYNMQAPQGPTMWGRWVFREVVPPEKLVFVASFSDEQGNITRAPFNPDWPLEVLFTVAFTEEQGRTTLSMTGEPINASEKEREVFRTSSHMMEAGWKGTLDQLTDYLQKG